MANGNPDSFVGFGFGPIQAGLFLLEASRSGRFRRLVVGEVLPDLVRTVRENGGHFAVNVAHPDHVESAVVGPVEMYDPGIEDDLHRLVQAVVEAAEVATAVPSTRFYQSDAPGSVHRVLARGLEMRRDRPLVVYAAENHNQAAEILEEAVLSEVGTGHRRRVRENTCFLNTVIGKMSRAVADPDEARRLHLKPLAPRSPRALLVERFNRILVSRPFPDRKVDFERALTVFEEKEDLLPFEEAKLYGHNAVHALAGYLAAHCNLDRIEELGAVPGAVAFLRAAFLDEAGAALLSKYKGSDQLFTEEGFTAYADDLLERMLNPYLGDRVERVVRDPRRKLGWNDRLVGTLRLALEAGGEPRRFALGTAAALVYLEPGARDQIDRGLRILESLWREDAPDPAASQRVRHLVKWAVQRLDGERVFANG